MSKRHASLFAGLIEGRVIRVSMLLVAGAALLVLWLRAKWHAHRYGQAFSLTSMQRTARLQVRAAQRTQMFAKAATAKKASTLFWKVAGIAAVVLIVRVLVAMHGHAH